MTRRGEDSLARLMRHVDQSGECWLWTGYVNRKGYGHTYDALVGYSRVAHRVLWELLNGPLPDDRQLDHLCRVRNCVNPAHLEPVSGQVNQDRGLNGRRDVCDKAGHPMTPDNVGGRRDGRRYCKACHRARNARNAPVTHRDF